MNRFIVILSLFLTIHLFTDFHNHFHHLEVEDGCFLYNDGIHDDDHDDHDHESIVCHFCKISKQFKDLIQKQVYSIFFINGEDQKYSFTFHAICSQNILSSTLSRAPPFI